MSEVKIIIPSHKRAGRVSTHKFVKNAIICIPESQLPEYTKEHGNDVEIITHPDSIKGLALKRQWICEKFNDVFMIDDDIVGMYRLWPGKNPGMSLKMKPEEAHDRIQVTANAARDMGSFIFGFANSYDTRQYSGIKNIFQFTGYKNIYGLGFLNWKESRLKFPEDVVTGQDYWICGLNAFHNRFYFADNRFGFNQQHTFRNPGGLTEFRNFETEKNVYVFLKRMFGNAITRKDKANHMTKINHPYMRHLKVPF